MPIDPKIREYFQRKFGQEEAPVEQGFDGQRFAGGALDALGANARNSMRIYGVNPEGGASAQDAIVQNRERQRKQATEAEDRKMSAAKSIYEIDKNADQQAYDRDMDKQKLALDGKRVAQDYVLGKQKLALDSAKPDLDDQTYVRTLSAKNANKESIANQIKGYIDQFNKAPTEEEKLTIGRQMLKVLNSPEGSDAIGAEEASRLGSKLEFAFGNFTNDNSTQFGRDLPGFGAQATATEKAIRASIEANQGQINQRLGKHRSPAPAGKPKRIMQGGYEYILNEETGEYE